MTQTARIIGREFTWQNWRTTLRYRVLLPVKKTRTQVLPTLESIQEKLPVQLSERIRVLRSAPEIHRREFVLYWMCTAVRADENPALETAVALAQYLDLPLLVYHGLSERYPYASDRHHTFIMEGARDVQQQLMEREIPYIFHLEQHQSESDTVRNPLTQLARRAAIVVVEEMPVRPLRQWQRALANSAHTPILVVDTACVVPMQRVAELHTRAYAFRDATSELRATRLGHTFEPRAYTGGNDLPDLPFHPLDLQRASIADSIASCEIDHTVPPVLDTEGGSRAGYARWDRFVESGLATYHQRRNDATINGVSRMSAYLHYGMVAPFRLARDASAANNPGAEKYLDELLIWRELAYHFCFRRRDHERTSALPTWARQTLQEHESDAREGQYSWEQLARAQTDDALWNAAQRSLILHGELHNNVRMTWGKAIVNWTPNARTALRLLIDLNHRFALDGRDPASYGGLLWCLGQFDRPFQPAKPIFGTVRMRPTKEHVQRLDLKKYQRCVTRSVRSTLPTVAIVGAGMAGLTCARILADHQIPVTVFEKSRGVGGRMATRRHAALRFDHGAQYFTARDARFRTYVDSWLEDGHVMQWHGRIRVLRDGAVEPERQETHRYVGHPNMNSICKHLGRDLEIRFASQVSKLKRAAKHWKLTDSSGDSLGEFDIVISTAPPPQTANLIAPHADFANAAFSNVSMRACWALMLSLGTTLKVDFDGAFVHDSSLSWVARNSSKPGRSQLAGETWTLHASAAWSDENLERPADEVAHELLTEFGRVTRTHVDEVEHAQPHRWRFAIPSPVLNERSLFDSTNQLGACGDWCGGPRVEGAFLSGAAMAGRVLGQLKRRQAYSHVTDLQRTPAQQQLF